MSRSRWPPLSTPLLVAVAVSGAVLLGLLVAPWAGAVLGGVAAFAVLVAVEARSRRTGVETAEATREADSVWPWPEALDRLSEGLLVLDGRRAVVYANRAAAALFGREHEEIAGQPLIRAAWSSELARLVTDAEGVPREVALERGRTALATALHPSGHPLDTLVLLHEVSDSRRVDRSRTELMANLSHELRTPIAAARVLAETLEGGVEDDERRERYQQQLLAELDRLASIVDRTLRLSRIEAGVEPLDLVATAPGALVSAAVARLSPVAEGRGVELRTAVEAGLPAVNADFDRAVEVLALLIDNAVKFSPPDEPVVVSAAATEAGFVTFEVRDRGPGVLPAERERVFERLYTGDRARTGGADAPSGFGLGLAIARHLVARMGGRIWVADVEGPGAAFRFTLPVATEA